VPRSSAIRDLACQTFLYMLSAAKPDNEEFRGQYAREAQADYLAEEVIEIADKATPEDVHVAKGWLGHRSITSTAVYTALAPNRFKDFWR
jgi:hypothetical protein